MSTQRIVVALATALLCATGCDRREHANPSASTAVTVVADAVQLEPLRWSPTAPHVRARLADALPANAPAVTQWSQITVRGHGRTLEVPVDKYRNYELYLYREDDGRTALGLFQTPITSAAKPIRAIVGVERIDIVTRAGAAHPPPQAKLEIARDGAVRDVPLDKLATLSSVTWRPDGRRKDTTAWRAKDVLLLSGPVGEHATIHVISGDGTSRVVQPSELDAMVVRHTPDGTFHIKKTGAAGVTEWHQRDVRRIDISAPL